MEAINFQHSNTIYGPPDGMTEDQVRSIFVFKGADNNQRPVVVECWKPDIEDLERLKRGEPLWLMIHGHDLPPVRLTTESPFT